MPLFSISLTDLNSTQIILLNIRLQNCNLRALQSERRAGILFLILQQSQTSAGTTVSKARHRLSGQNRGKSMPFELLMIFTIICNQYLGSAETERILVAEPRAGEEVKKYLQKSSDVVISNHCLWALC